MNETLFFLFHWIPSWQGNIWYDYGRWQLDIKDIMNILYFKIKDSQSNLTMCLSWILAEDSIIVYVE